MPPIQRTALTSAVGTGASGQAQPNAVQDFAYQALENLSFSELKQRSWINKFARAADQDPDFSRLIRANLPQTD